MRALLLLALGPTAAALVACGSIRETAAPISAPVVVDVALDATSTTNGRAYSTVLGSMFLGEDGTGWVEFDVTIERPGRYRTELVETWSPGMGATAWVEDYVGNPDGRTYDITGPVPVVWDMPITGGVVVPPSPSRDGSPLDAGIHRMRLHFDAAPEFVTRGVRFTLLRDLRPTPRTLTQSTDGGEWELVWADEFDGAGLPDPRKWTHDLGNWGWGNREPQYYTDADTDNARQEGGNLVIEARPNDDGHAWTSARLTTRGKVSFLYGRIEIRAKVPATPGVWAAGWTLGDAYRDELSWPYCGEIDILEAVGREFDENGVGQNHASCHTRAYYFKQGNHISNVLPVENMATEFHDYVCEWDEDEVRMYVDDVHYYTYAQKESAEAWPFDAPQNLILNLAMGGGMGGEIAPDAGPQKLVIDHVRVYGKK